MKIISTTILSILAFSITHAQVQSAGTAVTLEAQNSASLTTMISVPSSAFSSNLIAVAVTEYQHNFPVTITDKESGKNFTLAQSSITSNGSLLAIYYLANAANGLHTINLSTGAGNNTNIKTITSVYSGVDALSPIAYAKSNFNTSVNNSPALSIACSTDQVVVNALVFEAMTAEAVTPMTGSIKSPWNMEGGYKTNAAGVLNMNWDYSTSPRGFWASLAITLQPTTYAIVPGQLFNFNGKLTNNKVELSWITTFETNVKYISVMKSSDNKEWKEVSRLAGAGTSTGQKQYSTEDRNIEAGNAYYKLVFISSDGKKSNSFIVNVKSASDKKLKFGNMANPFNNALQVNLLTNSDKKVLVTMINSRGVTITSQYLVPQNGSINFAMEPSRTIAPGVYFLRCSSEDEMISKTIVKN